MLSGRWYKGYEIRLGFFSSKLKQRLASASKHRSLWIHAVSVGEVMAIMPLVASLKIRLRVNPIVVTTTTKTGYQLAKEQLGQEAIVMPSPVDLRRVTASFVRLINPRIYIVAETEIWPHLFGHLWQQKVPIVMVNGRISDVSYRRYKAIKFLLKSILEKVSLFCMQSAKDAQRIIELGAPPEKVMTVGNIKFDDLPPMSFPHVPPTDGIPPKAVTLSGNLEVASTRSPIIPPRRDGDDKLLWVAGSTHPGEEEIVLDVFAKHKDGWNLVIAPRHVERSSQIKRLVASRGLTSFVTVVDTIGQLRWFYAQASLVFVGKSFCVGGGHNIIEPAFYAKPIIVGPLMQNFQDITALFKNQGAIVQVKNVHEFETEVNRLMGNALLREQLGQKALGVVKANQGAGARTLQAMEKWLT